MDTRRSSASRVARIRIDPNQPAHWERLVHSARTNEPDARSFDPEKVLVGTIEQRTVRSLPDGVYELARDTKSGAHLWGRVINGVALCMRPTDAKCFLIPC
jgi:hypothetical protein